MLKATALAAAFALPASGLLAQDTPVPPCAGSPYPAAAAVGAALNQVVWMEDDLPADWAPPSCTGWSAGPTKILLAAAGRFRMAGGSEALAARLTRFSSLTELIYWSSSRGKWRNLFEEATALSGPDRNARRGDFTADDFVSSAELHYWLEEDNPTAGVVYQMRVRERTSDRLVFETVNLTPLRARLLIFRAEVTPPGDFRQLYFIERESQDVWHYYSLIRLGRARSLVGTSAANYRNRAEAFFRFLAGLKMDREPPASP